MKQILCVVLCCVLLTGCTAPASPASPAPTDSTSTSVSGGTTTRIQISISSGTTTTKSNTSATPPVSTEDHTSRVPQAAAEYGYTKLAFFDDFDSPETIDYSGKGRAGYNWYIDRPYGWSTLSALDFSIKNSVLTIGPKNPYSSYSLSTYSKAGDTGFLWQYGYAEARIRFEVTDIPGSADGRTACPAFWGISVHDVRGEKWTECGELDVMEVFLKNNSDPNSGVYYGGALHDHVKTADGKKIGTNLANANGYNGIQYLPDDDWHTYAALWTEGYIAWYIDGEFMHSVTFEEDELPVFHFSEFPDPLPSKETDRNWKGAHTIMNSEELVVILGGDAQWPMEVDWVHVWAAP